MGRVNPCHCDYHFLTTVGQAAVPHIRPPWPQQSSATLHRSNHADDNAPRTRWTSLHRVGTATPPSTEDSLQANTCKNPVTPCGYKRGGRAHIKGTRTQDERTHTLKPQIALHIWVMNITLSISQSRDLELSPLSQLACTPLLQALSGAKQYRHQLSHWT